MLSRTVEYAVRAVVLLGRKRPTPVSADDVAEQLGTPRNYLAKTLNALARRGIVTGARGPGGGFTLAQSPARISIADIVDVFSDGEPERARCLLNDSVCDSRHPCAAHRRWSAITQQAREPLLRTTIAELCDETSSHDVVGRP